VSIAICRTTESSVLYRRVTDLTHTSTCPKDLQRKKNLGWKKNREG